MRAGIELAKKEGLQADLRHSQKRLTKFWAHLVQSRLIKNYKLVFSDFDYTEMVIELEPHPEPITIETDPYVIIRPEGEWHKLGVLDQSANRPASSPIHTLTQLKKCQSYD